MKIVVWQTAFLGDLILTTPLLHSIKNIFPKSKLYVITKPFGKEVLKNNPYVDKIILYDKKNTSNIQIIKELRKEGFDIAISPHRSHRASYSLFLSKIPFRVGFDKAGFSFLYTKTVPHRFDGTHEIDRNLSLLSVFPDYSEKKLHRYPEIFLSEDEERSFEKFFLKEKKYILVAPGSKWETKRWTVKGFSRLIDILSEKGESVVLIGSKEDIPYTESIIKNIKTSKVINLVGKTTLRESFSIIKSARLLISNDSAPVHMAVAFNTPVVDIYGPTVKDFGFYPYRNGVVVELDNIKCRPCGLHGHKKCPTGTFECMEKITPDMVLDAVNKLII
ncbi:heptosyltransferase-2 [Persephonella hydrogeniphila]|uniref:lipopolysaccharide heptosyltransferase II n=1 Tax=Persephonella hydrogeniphila TaxID=198703 RepID=A0A285NJF0_9AQUI|nr:lipopolysaccharide heptosyltransferase II [Persephonella hydrogeniphila]SNZ09579.1 heptosyltransferase-2 [Persephonella hydrogeniphila]